MASGIECERRMLHMQYIIERIRLVIYGEDQGKQRHYHGMHDGAGTWKKYFYNAFFHTDFIGTNVQTFCQTSLNTAIYP